MALISRSVIKLSKEWTKAEWQQNQEKVILEEYMEHLALQSKDKGYEKRQPKSPTKHE
jgi:hypothetical protein